MTTLISGSQMKSLCLKHGLYGYFKSGLTDAHIAAYDEMQGGELNFIDGDSKSIVPVMQAIINSTNESAAHNTDVLEMAGENLELVNKDINTKSALTSLLAECVSIANPEPLPLSQAEQNRRDGVYTQKEVVDFSKNRVILLTINGELPEPCLAYLYDIDEGFEDKYFGKAEPIKPAVKKYKITPPANVKPNGKLFVRIPFDVDFTVEAV